MTQRFKSVIHIRKIHFKKEEDAKASCVLQGERRKMTKQELFDKFVELMGRFADIRAVAALRDGFIMTTPFTICGSVFLLLANLPIPGYAEFMAGIFGKDWTIPLNAVAGGTFSVLAVIAVLAITYKYVEAEGCDAIMASILALSTFIIILPPFAANRTVPSSTTSSRRPGLAATASSRPSS